MIAIRFTRACAPYHAGEVAAFPEEMAKLYVTKGIGEAVKVEPKPPERPAQKSDTKA